MAKREPTVLTVKTMGKVIQRLRQIMSGPVLCQNQFGQHPMRVPMTGDKAWGKFWNKTYHGAEVVVHPFFRDPPPWSGPRVLIRVCFAPGRAAVFHEGDLFYWGDGRGVMVDHARPWMGGGRYCERYTKTSAPRMRPIFPSEEAQYRLFQRHMGLVTPTVQLANVL